MLGIGCVERPALPRQPRPQCLAEPSLADPSLPATVLLLLSRRKGGGGSRGASCGEEVLVVVAPEVHVDGSKGPSGGGSSRSDSGGVNTATNTR